MRGGAETKPIYEIGSPIFDEIRIHLNPKYYPGKKITIQTKNNSATNRYIQSATFNGKPLTKPWFYHTDFVNGAVLKLNMGSQPNKSWGSNPSDAPPSMSNENISFIR